MDAIQHGSTAIVLWEVARFIIRQVKAYKKAQRKGRRF